MRKIKECEIKNYSSNMELFVCDKNGYVTNLTYIYDEGFPTVEQVRNDLKKYNFLFSKKLKKDLAFYRGIKKNES